MRGFGYLLAFAVKDNHDSDASAVLIITQSLDQRFTCQGRPPFVQFSQIGPGEDHAVTVNNQIARPHPKI